MIHHERNGLEWLEFELFAECPLLKHAIFLRKGGMSPPPYDSLNLSHSVGDHPDNVTHNRKLVQTHLSVPQLVTPRLSHGDTVMEIQPSNLMHPIDADADAVLTEHPDVGLLITQADCQAAIFYDPVHHAVANVHSGWRGSVQNIYARVVEKMQKLYGTNPSDLLVGVSPSLGPNSAEFIHYQKELPESFWSFQSDSHHFDFWEITRHQLENLGVLSHHVEIAKIDTYGNPAEYFSYRRDQTTGRMGTAVALNR